MCANELTDQLAITLFQVVIVLEGIGGRGEGVAGLVSPENLDQLAIVPTLGGKEKFLPQFRP